MIRIDDLRYCGNESLVIVRGPINYIRTSSDCIHAIHDNDICKGGSLRAYIYGLNVRLDSRTIRGKEVLGR